MKKALVKIAAPVAVGAAALLALPGTASAADTTSYSATLNPLNNQTGASGTLMLQLNGSTATITEQVSGLAQTFMNAPFPHVQHIHGGAAGMCPTQADDANGDGVVSTPEAAKDYGSVLTTLSVSGDTSASAATDVKIAPSGGSYSYSRTINLDSATMQAIQNGTAVIVVHGLDPATAPKAATTEKSPLVPSLPLAATAPALCGKLVASQMSSMPAGGAATGGGSTAGVQDGGLLALGGALLLGATGIGVAARRRATQH